MCVAGVCTGCTDDSNCGTGQVCDKDHAMCVPGCREVGGKSNCIAPLQCSKQDGTIGTCVALSGADGGVDGGADGGPLFDDAGSIQGGGCSCRTTPFSGSPLAAAAAAALALLAVKRRRDRKKTENQTAQEQADHQERG